jgi:hypothetical protein
MGMEIGSLFLPAPPSDGKGVSRVGSPAQWGKGKEDSRRGKRGAGPKGSDMTKFEEGMSAILSISKRFKKIIKFLHKTSHRGLIRGSGAPQSPNEWICP